MTRASRGLAAVCLLFTVGPNAHAGDNPFLVPREELVSRVRTIALAGPTLPRGISERHDARKELGRLAKERLESAGFTTLDADSYAVARKASADTVRGLFDPVTGKRDSTRVRALEAGVRARLRASGADAILFLEVVPRTARFSGEEAKWDGVSVDGGRGQGVLDFLLGVGYSGSLGALSLSVRLEDLSGAVLYSSIGGIQLTTRVEDKKFVDVPSTELLRDPERNAKAVRVALSPLEKR